MTDYCRLSHWATDSERRAAFEYMFRCNILPPGVWKVLFQPTALEPFVYSRLEDRRFRTPARTIDWSRSPVGFQFGVKRRIEQDSIDFKKWPSPRIARIGTRYYVLQDDALFCGVYCLNNLARGLVFNPGLALEAIVCQRRGVSSENAFSMYAQRDQLVLMALREGVVLASINFGNPNHCEALMGKSSGTKAWPFENLIRQSGGMALLFPCKGGRGGHYISVVPVADDKWVTFDTREVVTKTPKATVGHELIEAIARRFIFEPPEGESDREVLGLLALPVRPYVLNGPPNNFDVVDMWVRNLLQTGITTSLAEFTCPTITPLAVNFAIHTATLAKDVVPTPRYEGERRPNLFTLYAAQFAFQSDWNSTADSIASMLVKNGANDDSPRLLLTAPGNHANTAELAARVTSLASGLRPYLGLLFVSNKLVRNRDWLRYIVVYDVARRVGRKLRAIEQLQKREPNNSKLRPSTPLLKLLALICMVAWSSHREAGEHAELVATMYPNLVLLVTAAKQYGFAAVFTKLSSFTSFGLQCEAFLKQSPHQFVDNMARHCYDRSLYLLTAAAETQCCSFTHDEVGSSVLEALNNESGRVFTQDEKSCEVIDYLRNCVFVLPELSRPGPKLYEEYVMDRFDSMSASIEGEVEKMFVSAWAYSSMYYNWAHNRLPTEAVTAHADSKIWCQHKEAAAKERDVFPQLIDLLYNVVGFDSVYVSVFEPPVNAPESYPVVTLGLDARLVPRQTHSAEYRRQDVDVVDTVERDSSSFANIAMEIRFAV
jgi:hypothetical protein